jgi:DNA-binding response OmpR family regulator
MNPPPLKILAVDSEQLLLCALERGCKGKSFGITTASTTEQALESIEHSHFDLFLLELDLQYRESLQLLKTIDARCPYVPIIVMSASLMSTGEIGDVIRTVRKHGAWHLLEKPFSLDKMLSFVKDIFQEHDHIIHGMNSLTHNYDQENRDQFRRPYVQPIYFSFKTVVEGASKRIPTKGILTDISEYGSGILAHQQLHPAQVVSFEDGFVTESGIVAWSVMIEKETCRFGVQFC